MLRILSIICLIFPQCLSAQVSPIEGKVLNYRVIGFSAPAETMQNTYTLEIAKGNYGDDASFRKNIIIRQRNLVGKVVAEVPDFGSSYTWRVTKPGLSSDQRGILHHFSTHVYPDRSEKSRLKITRRAEKFEDGYVFLDGTRTLYDMEGKPVWFLLDTTDVVTPGIRDMKVTPENTITFITDECCAYEIAYDGTILWKGPDNGAVSAKNGVNYHHEITRLPNGHYMMLCNEQLQWKDLASEGYVKEKEGIEADKKVILGTVVEYDAKGELVWKWKSSEYFRADSLYYYKTSGTDQNYDPHMNSFYFDQKAGVVYISFKKLSRIVKVKYPEGTVIDAYGERYSSGLAVPGKQLFCSQHSCKVSKDGYLYLYNNNDCNYPDHPTVLFLKEPSNRTDSVRKVWEYVCPVESDKNARPGKPPMNSYSSGGNAMELPDGSVFICVSSPFGFSPVSNVSIVGRDKKILWSATPEKWNTDKQEWQMMPQYRGSVVTSRSQLEALIWKSDPAQ